MRAAPLAVLVSTTLAATAVRVREPSVRIDPLARGDLRKTTPSGAEAGDAFGPVPTPDPPDAAVGAGPPRMLHSDERHSNRAHGALPKRPDVAWTFHADGPIEGQVVASPDGQTLYVATLGGSLIALDRAGHRVFEVALGGRAYGTPCVGPDGTVYVGSDGGAFTSVDAAGHVKWRLETPGDADTAAVVTDAGLVVFAAGSRLYGVRGGLVVFRFKAKGKIFTAPTLAHAHGSAAGLVVVGSQDHHVYAVTSRELAWSVDLAHDVDGSAAIGDDGALYVGTDGDEVVRLDDEGRVAWRASVGGPVRGALSIARNGDVLAGVYGPSPGLVRVSPEGEVRSVIPVRGHGTRETGVLGGALEDDDGALAFGAQDGAIRVVERDGRARWVFDAGAEVDAPLTLLPDGSLVAAAYDGTVRLFR